MNYSNTPWLTVAVVLLLAGCSAQESAPTPEPPSVQPFVVVRQGSYDDSAPEKAVETKIPFSDGLTLMAVFNRSGGIIQSGGFRSMKKLRILRGGKTTDYDIRKFKPDGSNNPLLEAGDIILVPY
jgi:hypothetical protein